MNGIERLIIQNQKILLLASLSYEHEEEIKTAIRLQIKKIDELLYKY